jgi:hypothetical protein
MTVTTRTIAEEAREAAATKKKTDDKLKEKLKKAQARLAAEKEHLRISREKLESRLSASD